MKKILSLLALLVTTMTAFAQTFTDKSVVTVGSSTSTMETAKLEVTDKGDGTFDVLFKDVVNVSGNYTDNYGDVGFSGLTAATENGVTTLTGSSLEATTFTGAGHGYIGAAAKIGDANITVKFNASKAYAQLEAKYMQLGFGSGAAFNITFGDENFSTPEPPATSGTKILEDGFAPNGTAIAAKPFSINWNSQKIVAHLDMTAEDGENCNIMSFSDNESDVAEWNVQNGYTLHFFYTKNSNLWTTSGWMQATNCFTIQFRNVTTTDIPTAYVNNIEDPSNVKIEITKDGIYVNGELKMEASQIEAFYTKSDLYFGALQGDARSKAVYNLLEVQDVENGGSQTTEPVVYTEKMVIKHNNTTEPETQATVEITDKGEGNYKIVVKGITDPDGDSVGDLAFLATGTEADGKTTYTATDAEATLSENGWSKATVSMTGESKDGKLSAQITADLQNLSSQNPDYLYTILIGEQPDTPVEPTATYTEKAHTTYWGDFDYTDKKVEVYDLGDNKQKVVYKDFNLGSGTTFDLVYDNVDVTTDAKNNTVYAFSGKATIQNVNVTEGMPSVADGDEVEATLNGKANGEHMFATFSFPVMGTTVTTVYGEEYESGEQTDGGLIEAGYQPNGASWSKSTAIDWDKQYVKAVIDLSTCKGTNENILSVGKSISEWAAYPHYHFYYTASTKNLQFNAMMPDNKSRYDITLDSDELTIEISKKEGLKINGTQYLNQYNTSTQYADIDAYLEACAPFFALTEIEYGGCQGDNMSNATYKYFNVLDLPEEGVTVKSSKDYTDQVVVENIDTNEKVKKESYVLTVNEMSDGSQQLVFKNLPISETETADYTINCNLTWSDGDNGTKKVTLNEENTSVVVDGKECALYGNALINNDGSLYVYGLLGAVDYSKDLVKIWFGTVKTTDGINSVNADVESGNAEVYTVGGAKVSGLQKGVNIVRLANGKTIKIIK